MGENRRETTIKGKILKSFKDMRVYTNAIGLIGIIFIILTNILYSGSIKKYGFVQGDIGKFEVEVEKSKYLLNELVTSTDNSEKQSYAEKLNESNKIIEELLPKIEGTNITKKAKEKYLQIVSTKDEYGKSIGEIIELAMENKKEKAAEVLNSKEIILIEDMEKLISELLELKITQGNRTVGVLIALCIIEVILTVFFMINISKKSKRSAEKHAKEIADPIYEISELANKIAEGNLDVNINIDSDDEVGKLGKAFELMVYNLKSYISDISNILESISNKNLNIKIEQEYKGDFVKIKESLTDILKSLNEVFIEIKNASKEVSGGADQVSSTAQVTSEGATNQAAQVEELLASIQEINGIVNNNMNNAKSTNEIYQNIVKDVETENKNVLRIVKSMDEIKNASDDIKGIIGAIQEIAEQTDLLALNAAIEAARVGEAGKGFAVVADEIRELSNQSSNAVSRTQELIEKAINVSNNGKDLVDSTAKSLLEVIKKIEESSELISGIAEESNTQANKIGEINEVILQVSDVVASNSAIAEESAAASEELTAQAITLDNMIETFKLTD